MDLISTFFEIGLWFRVDTVTEVSAYLGDLKAYAHKLPAYNHDREEDYNKDVADSDGSFHLMDKQTVQIGGDDKLEFCDLIKDGNATDPRQILPKLRKLRVIFLRRVTWRRKLS